MNMIPCSAFSTSLSAAASGDRKRSLNLLLEGIIRKEGVVSVLTRDQVTGHKNSDRLEVAKLVNELAPSRSEESKYQLTQFALNQNLKSRSQISQIVDHEKAFTAQLLTKSLNQNGQVLSSIFESMQAKSISIRLYLAQEFMGGYWNPASKLRVVIQVSSKAELAKLDEEIKRVLSLNKSFKDSLDIQTTDQEPASEWLEGITLSAESSHFLSDVYSDIALKDGDLYGSINTVGNLSFTKVEALSDSHDCEAALN